MILRYKWLCQSSIRIFIGLIEETATLITWALVAYQIVMKQSVMCDLWILNAVIVWVILKTAIHCVTRSMVVNGFILSFKWIHIQTFWNISFVREILGTTVAVLYEILLFSLDPVSAAIGVAYRLSWVYLPKRIVNFDLVKEIAVYLWRLSGSWSIHQSSLLVGFLRHFFIIKN